MNYLLDTNIITAILKGNKNATRRAQKVRLEGKRIFINGISYYECKRGLLAINAIKKLKIFEEIVKEYGLVGLDDKNIFDKASEIYADLKRGGKPIPDADILIASIAIFGNFILVSCDAHFNRIKHLKIENWIKN